MNVRDLLIKKSLGTALDVVMAYGPPRRFLLSRVEARLRDESLRAGPELGPLGVRMDRLDVIAGLLHGLDRIIAHRQVSKQILRSMLEAFLGNVILNDDAKRVHRRTGVEPPSFVTISPTGRCNLRCQGCYAADAGLSGGQLDFETFDRILREKRELWGSHWTVISGGEPFVWRDGEWDLLKVARRHPHDVFMVYTNGTLIDDDLAQRLADVGNITPAVSVEGFRLQTDRRRGDGVYDSIMAALDRLRKHGVPFGISATATKDNWRAVTCDDFMDFYFINQGALYGWIFQYMPMGRQQSLDLVVSPEDRVEMSRRMWKQIRERKVFLVDFWNSATVSMGCISAARPGGYFHINWDGDIMPCVFTPYAAGNIRQIYAAGGDITSVLTLPFFERIREWQQDYGFHKPAAEVGNWLCPCAIRDHFDTFYEIARSVGARAINAEARQALADPEYHQGMIDYGQRMADLTDDTWATQYLEADTRPVEECVGEATG